jgi:hypothetical protein
MGVTTQELQAILDQMNKLKEEMLQEVREKCTILGLRIVEEPAPAAPKQKRKRRTKAEIAADNAKSPPMPSNTL